MSPLAPLFLPLFLASAGAPGALEEALVTAREEARLPVAFAIEVAPELSLGFHHREDWSLAFYLPASPAAPPSLRLYAPFYLQGLQLVPLAELRVDTADYLFHSLARAHIELEVLGRGGPLAQVMRDRALEALPEVPASRRLDAYLDAASSYISHALSVAIELERKHREWVASDRSLCPDRAGRPLFDLWERIFGEEPYQGAYSAPPTVGEPVGAGALVYSRNALRREDKELLSATLLAGAWTGRAGHDFGHFCEPAAGALE